MRCLFASFVLAASLPVFAQVVQPNGTTIPLGNNLSGYLNGSANNDNLNEGIDVINDAAVEPQQFAPQCEFGGKYIAKGGGANFAIGWYNVNASRPDSSPPRYVPVDTGPNLNTADATSEVQLLFPFASSLPAADMRELTAASIRQHSAYAGGLIGLVLVPNPNGTGNGNATQYHYTEHRFNTQCTLCSTPGPWYSHLTYRSKLLANTFYLGFEDLDFTNAAGSAGVNGNDLDYEDFLFRFTGLTCPAAGVPCTVPNAEGACARGVTDCNTQGQTICVPAVAPGQLTETCDGVDNNCDGAVDESATCPGFDQVCDRGACVTSCTGEFYFCAENEECIGGKCTDPACVGVMCNSGEVCVAGQCKTACADVQCPYGTECNNGVCIDPCAGVTCGTGKVCQGGVCVTGCTCGACAAGLSCNATTNRCEESACVGVSCNAGTHCVAGSCVDECAGAVCPTGQQCTAGSCVDVPPAPADAGSGGGTGHDADGGTHGSDGGTTGGGGGNLTAGATGCGCATSGGDALALLALGVTVLRRGRQRAR